MRYGWAIYLNDWGAYTASGYFTGNKHPSGAVRRTLNISSAEDAYKWAALLKLSGRLPCEIWYDGKLYASLAPRQHVDTMAVDWTGWEEKWKALVDAHEYTRMGREESGN